MLLGISRDVHGTDDDEKNDAESVTVEESGLSKAEEKKADLPKRTLPLSPTARRSGFVPLTEKEFFSVSDLVRGRIKLEDVNEVRERGRGHLARIKYNNNRSIGLYISTFR